MKFEKKICKYREVLLGLNLKQVITTLPKVIGINILLLAVLGVMFFFTMNVSNSNTEREVVQVGLVTEDNSWWINTLASYLEQNINCRFTKMSEEEAMDKMEKEELTAVLLLPENVVSAIMASEKDAAILIFKKPGPFSALKSFQNLARTGMSDIAALDGAEKLIAQIQERTKGWSNSSEVYAIEDKLIMKCVQRFSTFDKTVYSDSGDLDLVSFYIGNILLAIILFTGVFLQEILSRKSPDYLISLKRIGISFFEVSMYQLLSVVIVYSAFFYIVYGILAGLGLVSFSVMGLVAILIFVLDTIGIIFLTYQLCDSKFTAGIYIFLGTLVMMFFSGNIVPISLLPSAARYISVVLPVKYFAQITGEVVAGEITGSSLLAGILWFGLFLLIQAIACKVRKTK